MYSRSLKVTGSWKLVGVDTEQVSDAGKMGYVAKSEVAVRSTGEVVLTFDDGSWAEVTMDDNGQIDGVGDCDQPSRNSKYTCSLEGKTVVFSAQR